MPHTNLRDRGEDVAGDAPGALHARRYLSRPPAQDELQHQPNPPVGTERVPDLLETARATGQRRSLTIHSLRDPAGLAMPMASLWGSRCDRAPCSTCSRPIAPMMRGYWSR